MCLVSWPIYRSWSTGLCLQSSSEDLLPILRQSSPLSLGISLVGVLSFAKYGTGLLRAVLASWTGLRLAVWGMVISCTVETG